MRCCYPRKNSCGRPCVWRHEMRVARIDNLLTRWRHAPHTCSHFTASTSDVDAATMSIALLCSNHLQLESSLSHCHKWAHAHIQPTFNSTGQSGFASTFSERRLLLREVGQWHWHKNCTYHRTGWVNIIEMRWFIVYKIMYITRFTGDQPQFYRWHDVNSRLMYCWQLSTDFTKNSKYSKVCYRWLEPETMMFCCRFRLEFWALHPPPARSSRYRRLHRWIITHHTPYHAVPCPLYQPI